MMTENSVGADRIQKAEFPKFGLLPGIGPRVQNNAGKLNRLQDKWAILWLPPNRTAQCRLLARVFSQ
jgi:hypothetical protein